MTYLYYTFGIFIFFLTLSSLLRFNKIYKIKEWYSKFKKITGKEPSLVDFRERGDKRIYVNHNFSLGLELIWIILGFFTIDKLIFLSVFTINFIINLIFNKNKFTLPYKVTSFIFLSSRVGLYLFLIVKNLLF